jgi:hypothetical protein
MMRILNDIRVCTVEEHANDFVSVEICKNATKTNIEESDTYKKICAVAEQGA